MAVSLPRIRTVTRPQPGVAALATFLATSYVEVQRTVVWERHRHVEHEVIVVSRGSYRCTINGEVVRLATGHAVVIQPGDWHEDDLAEGTGYFAIWFRLSGGLLAPDVAPAQRAVRFADEALIQAASRLQQLAEEAAPAARLDVGLATLIGLLVDGLPPAARSPAFSPAADGFVTRLHAQFARLPAGRVDTIVLASACRLTRRTLERHCRDELGCGPAEAHMRWRIQRAAELLRSTDWPIRAVSETLGFTNPFHFSRAFARVHGAPPASWRGGAIG